jgi:hypothetical protein
MSINNTILVEKHYIPLNLYKELYPSPNNTRQSIMPSFNSTTHPPVAQPYYDINNSPILNSGLSSIYTPLRRYYFNSPSVTPTTTASSMASTSTNAATAATATNAANATNAATAATAANAATPRVSVDTIYDNVYNDTFNYYSNLFNTDRNNRSPRTTRATDNIWGPIVSELFSTPNTATDNMATDNTATDNTTTDNTTTDNTTTNNTATNNTTTRTRTDNINGVNYSTRTTQRRTPRGYVSFEVSTAAFPQLDASTTTTNFINSLFRNLGGLNLNTDTENQNYGLTEQEIFNNTENYIANFRTSRRSDNNDTDDDNVDTDDDNDVESNVDNEEQQETENDIDTKCSICHDEMVNGQRLKRILSCNHSFHQQCIEPWFANHNTCPLCRTSVVRTEAT